MPIDDDQVERFVFDACALIAYLNDEPGADKVEDLLDQAQQNRVQVYVTAVNIYEVFTIGKPSCHASLDSDHRSRAFDRGDGCRSRSSVLANPPG